MIINIEDEHFFKIKSIMKNRNIKIFKILDDIEPLQLQNDILNNARKIRTNKKKAEIKESIKNMICSNIQPTKYKIYKKTGISYVTLNKYYNEIFDEVLEEIKS